MIFVFVYIQKMKTRNRKDTKQTLTYGCYKLQITNNYISVLVYAKSFYNTNVNFVPKFINIMQQL